MTPTVQEALALATTGLRAAGIDSAPRDARVLMAAALGVEPGRVTLHLRDGLSATAHARFLADVERRATRVPVSHILGYRDFFGRRFTVTPDVLDPRPETETLVELALTQQFERVLDLGTGSGAIVVTLLAERPMATGIGADLSEAARAVAARNADAHAVTPRCQMICSDWFQAVEGMFDLIVSNPPYIATEEMAGLAPELQHEPPLALTDHGDGLGAYRTIAAGALAHLRPGGRIMVEIGATQRAAVTQILAQAGVTHLGCAGDLDGRDRVIYGEKPT